MLHGRKGACGRRGRRGERGNQGHARDLYFRRSIGRPHLQPVHVASIDESRGLRPAASASSGHTYALLCTARRLAQLGRAGLQGQVEGAHGHQAAAQDAGQRISQSHRYCVCSALHTTLPHSMNHEGTLLEYMHIYMDTLSGAGHRSAWILQPSPPTPQERSWSCLPLAYRLIHKAILPASYCSLLRCSTNRPRASRLSFCD